MSKEQQPPAGGEPANSPPSEHVYKVPRRKPIVVRETAHVFGSHEEARKKNYRLRQSTIDRAMQLLGARTETEAIEMALDAVAFGAELAAGVRGMRGAEISHPFASESEAE
jgi:hypothetical protein